MGGLGLQKEVLCLQTSPPTGPEGESPLRTNVTQTRTTPSVASVSQTFFGKNEKKKGLSGCEEKVAVLS